MITFKEIQEKDLNILASLYSVALLELKPEENWTNDTAFSYLSYFYNLQPDLFICAYDDGIPIGAIFSILKPFWNGLQICDLEVFVSKDYQGQYIGKNLIQNHFALASSKYHVKSVNLIVNQDYLPWFQKIGLEAFYNRISLSSNIETCLENLEQIGKPLI